MQALCIASVLWLAPMGPPADAPSVGPTDVAPVDVGPVAPDPAPAPEPTPPTPEGTTVQDMTDEFKVLVDKDATLVEAVEGAVDTYEASRDLAKNEDKSAVLGLVMILLSAIFKTLLSIVKLVSKAFFQTRKGKTALRVTTLGLGLAVLVTTKVVIGMSWVEALFLALAGPGAIVVHELAGLFSGNKDEKDAQPAKPEEPKPAV